MIRILKSGQAEVEKVLNKVYEDQAVYEQRVSEILKEVRERGDEAVLEYTARFDKARLTPENLRVSAEEIEEAYRVIDKDVLPALQKARDNIAAYHENNCKSVGLTQKRTALSWGSWYAPWNGSVSTYPGVRPPILLLC